MWEKWKERQKKTANVQRYTSYLYTLIVFLPLPSFFFLSFDLHEALECENKSVMCILRNYIKLQKAPYITILNDGDDSFATVEAMANRKNDYENQGNYNTQNNQLYFHVLHPHLSSQLGSLLPKTLCLHTQSNWHVNYSPYANLVTHIWLKVKTQGTF